MAAKVIGVLVVFLVVAGVVFYFVSDPFKTKVDVKIEQATKWTPENIRKDPAGYVAFAVGQADRTIEALSARRIALSQQKSNNERMLQKASKDLATAKKIFDQFRAAYKEASAANGWPKEVAGTQYQEADLKKQIISLKSKIDSLQGQTTQLTGIQKTVGTHLDQLDQKLTDTKTTKTDLTQKLEIVKANKAIENIDSLKADVAGLAGIADFLTQSARVPSVDQLIQQQESTVSDADFSSILNSE
jgi:hypothetical protein